MLTAAGSVSAVKDKENIACSLKLKANHQYLVLGFMATSAGDESSRMSARLSADNSTNDWVAATAARTIMANGGGCTVWGYAKCISDMTVSLTGYGYSTSNYSYVGTMLAVQLK